MFQAPEYFETHLIPPKIDYCLLSVHKAASYFDSSRSVDNIEVRVLLFEVTNNSKYVVFWFNFRRCNHPKNTFIAYSDVCM